jgi:hypothetical protein
MLWPSELRSGKSVLPFMESQEIIDQSETSEPRKPVQVDNRGPLVTTGARRHRIPSYAKRSSRAQSVRSTLGRPQLVIASILVGVQLVSLDGCNTFTTLDPRTVDRRGYIVDETANHYGQSYFLPKGLIRLVIKPEGSSSGGPAGSGTSSVTINNYSGATPPTPKPAGADEVAKQKAGDNADDLTAPKAYSITVTRVIVPDRSQGPFTARYNPNWFYADNTSIGVTDDGLLTTFAADLSDRSSQVLFNLVDTATNAARIAAYFASQKDVRQTALKVRYRRLNIDVTFDPFVPADVAKVYALFESKPSVDAIYVSPITFHLHRVDVGSARGVGAFLSERRPKSSGLWFRELTPVEMTFTADTDEMLAEVGRRRVSEKIPKETTIEAENNAFGQHIARTTRLVVSVPNPKRAFAFNISRSAFVQNKKITLTIGNGMLTKVEMVKPSEAEGFSLIPLTISQKLLQLPKDLLSIRTERINAARDQNAAAYAGFNSQTQLEQAIATREDSLKKAQLTAEKERLQAEIDLLQKQRALVQAQAGNLPGPSPTPAP